MLQLLLFVNMVLHSNVRASEVSACEAALRDQKLPPAVIRRATSMARSHVIAHYLVDEADLRDVRLVAHAPRDASILNLEAIVDVKSQGPRYVSLKFNNQLAPIAARIVPRLYPPAAAGLVDWPRGRKGFVRFLPRLLNLDNASMKNIGQVALHHLQVSRTSFHQPLDVTIMKVVRAAPNDARALVRLRWSDVNGPERRSFFVVTNAAGEGFTSEDEPYGDPPDYMQLSGALMDYFARNAGDLGRPVEFAYVQEGGHYWAIVQTRRDGYNRRAWLKFGEDRRGARVVSHLTSTSPDNN